MDGLCSHSECTSRRPFGRACSILSGWTGFAALAIIRSARPSDILQYPQRMDGLCSGRWNAGASRPTAVTSCSILSGWTGFAASETVRSSNTGCNLAVSSADGRALQHPAAQRRTLALRQSCSILSGWTGFAASCNSSARGRGCALAVSSADGRALQRTPVRTECPDISHLQYPQRMDGLCSDPGLLHNELLAGLAVSSADGRALQPPRPPAETWTRLSLAVSSADGRALQPPWRAMAA